MTATPNNLNAAVRRLSPTETAIYQALFNARGRSLNSAAIRDKVMPDRHANNIRVHIRLMRLKGIPIVTSGRGPGAKGYRLELSA